jgi:hypothetical protein
MFTARHAHFGTRVRQVRHGGRKTDRHELVQKADYRELLDLPEVRPGRRHYRSRRIDLDRSVVTAPAPSTRSGIDGTTRSTLAALGHGHEFNGHWSTP